MEMDLKPEASRFFANADNRHFMYIHRQLPFPGMTIRVTEVPISK